MNTIRLNGEQRSVDATTLVELLRAESVDPDGRFVAVAVNGAVVPRSRWANAAVQDGDDIEIVAPAPGG
ncbi:MAG: sulfur carrier protein ThiS [Alphaproteobacteria bacterium]|nr:sulfur carrier protein ThiS [Alphaproteobacteria bacterium]